MVDGPIKQLSGVKVEGLRSDLEQVHFDPVLKSDNIVAVVYRRDFVINTAWTDILTDNPFKA
eukprot:9497392-Ditylum_brightwellii.AAC.1